MGYRGFTLVELMTGVTIVGVLAVLATYGVRKYVASSKTAEARSALGAIAKNAAAHYQQETIASQTLLLPGKASRTMRALCTSASASVPSSAASIKGKKYQSSPAEWNADEGTAGAGFACLKFSIEEPQYFMYSYKTSGSAAVGDTFSATANGDLNGDGHLSTFTLNGKIATGLVVDVAPEIQQVSPEE